MTTTLIATSHDVSEMPIGKEVSLCTSWQSDAHANSMSMVARYCIHRRGFCFGRIKDLHTV
jgi:hypothetical protein